MNQQQLTPLQQALKKIGISFEDYDQNSYFLELPASREDPDWETMKKDYNLVGVEYIALKNARCGPQMAAATPHPPVEGYYNVTHMQSRTYRRIMFPNSFSRFLDNCRSSFQNELAQHGARFKVYRMPCGVAQISDRERIDESNYLRLCEDMRCITSLLPVILLWSCHDDANDNSPNVRNYEDFQDVRSPGTSATTSVSGRIKTKYNFICQACKCDYQNSKITMNVCHILELEELQGLSTDESDHLVNECELDDIDDPRNYIPLCITCHDHFDFQRLGIKLENNKYYWQVKAELTEIKLPHDDQRNYGSLNGTEIGFLKQLRPPPELVAHRQQRYVENISSRTKTKKRKADEMGYLTFAATLQNICSQEAIADFWQKWKVAQVTRCARRPPNKDTDWEQIEPPSEAHGEAATFWYNPKTNRLWIKLRGG